MEKPSSSTELKVSDGPGGETPSTPEDTGEAPQPEGKVRYTQGFSLKRAKHSGLPLVTHW